MKIEQLFPKDKVILFLMSVIKTLVGMFIGGGIVFLSASAQIDELQESVDGKFVEIEADVLANEATIHSNTAVGIAISSQLEIMNQKLELIDQHLTDELREMREDVRQLRNSK